MNLNSITGLQASASQGVQLGDAVAAGAPSQAASPFAMLLAILAGPQAEVLAGSKPPVAPQGQSAVTPVLPQKAQSAVNPDVSRPALRALLSSPQIDANAKESDHGVQLEAQIEAAVTLPSQIPQGVAATPELPAGPPVVIVRREPAASGAVEQSEGKDSVAAPLPDQSRANLQIGAAVPAAPVLAPSQGTNTAALVQPSDLQSSTPSPLQPQPRSPVPDAQTASQAPAEIAKADAIVSAIVAVDPKIAGAAANDGQGPTVPPDKNDEAALYQQALAKKLAETARPSGPAQDAARKADVALDVDAGDNRPASPPPAEALKPAEPRMADMTIRAPEPIPAAPASANAQQADPATLRATPPHNPAPLAQVAVPVEGLAIQIARVAKSGERKFEIRLDPPELGKISVRLEVSREGVVTTHLTVERAETMDLLQRDARALERALGQAGLDQKGGGISFSLSDQNAHPQYEGRDTPHPVYPMASDEKQSPVAPAQPARFRSADSLLDIRI